jgi:hypothetical protein
MDFLCDIQKSAKRFTTDGIPEEPVEGGGRQQAGFARGFGRGFRQLDLDRRHQGYL